MLNQKGGAGGGRVAVSGGAVMSVCKVLARTCRLRSRLGSALSAAVIVEHAVCAARKWNVFAKYQRRNKAERSMAAFFA